MGGVEGGDGRIRFRDEQHEQGVPARGRWIRALRHHLRDRLRPIEVPEPGRCGPRFVSAATVALLLVGLLWRVIRYAVCFPVWGDEAFLAISLCERSLAGLARPLEYWQVAPWGFLAAEHGAVELLGRSE